MSDVDQHRATPLTIEPTAVVPDRPTAGDVAAYNALRSDAAWFECAYRWSSFRGEKAADALNGLVTNDVVALQPGAGQHAAALTPKGKLVSDLYILRLDAQAFLIAAPVVAVDAWLSLARKYVNPRLAKVADETARWAAWLLHGPNAAQAVVALGSADASEAAADAVNSMGHPSPPSEWPPWHHAPWKVGAASIRLIRVPFLGAIPGFVLLADAEDADVVRQQLASSPAVRGTPYAWEVARIESGRPSWGIDMNEDTLPQEANLDALGAISFSKGCYTGQETVARIHFRGHVNRNLRALLGLGSLPHGSTVSDRTGKVVGDVRGSVMSPRLGPIALAMLRREVQNGDEVVVRTNGGDVGARVAPLPFPDSR